MSAANLRSVLSGGGAGSIQQIPQSVSRSDTLIGTVAIIVMIAQVTIAILGIVHKMNPQLMGWSLVGLSVTVVVIPALKFLCSGEETRTNLALSSHVFCPILIEVGPFVAGLLTALGEMSPHTAGWVTVGIVGGLTAFACCCLCCAACCAACGQFIPQSEETEGLNDVRIHHEGKRTKLYA